MVDHSWTSWPQRQAYWSLHIWLCLTSFTVKHVFAWVSKSKINICSDVQLIQPCEYVFNYVWQHVQHCSYSCSGQYRPIKTRSKVNGGLLYHANTTKHKLSPALCHIIQPSNPTFLTLYSPSCSLYSMVIHHHLIILPTVFNLVNYTLAPPTYGLFKVMNRQDGTHPCHYYSTLMVMSGIHCHVWFRDN